MKKILSTILIVAAAMLCFAACTHTPGGEPEQPKLSETELTLTVGESGSLTLQLPDNAASETGVEYTWSSTNEAVATVSAEGTQATVTALTVGTAVITVSDGETEIGSCNVTVNASPLTVTVPEGRLVLRKGTIVTVRAKCKGASDEDFRWESSDEGIGTVENQGPIGRVKANSRGSCTITVYCGNYTTSFELIVGLT